MDEIRLIRPSPEYAEQIREYRDEFPADWMRVTYDPERIPGLDYLEKFKSIHDWIRFCDSMKDRITWYMSVRLCDGKIVGFCCLRHKLEYDDDDIEFASHIGYSVRPGEREKGYAREQLRLVLEKAEAFGIDPVRIICSERNEASIRTILANGGRFIDSVYGEESGLVVNRYEIRKV